MVKSLAVAIQKGGVGKTTIVTHLAWRAAEKGNSVLVIDVDSQKNASSTLRAQADVLPLSCSDLFQDQNPSLLDVTPTPGKITLVEADAKLVNLDKAPHSVLSVFDRQVRKMAAPFDYLFVDVGPSVGNRMLGSLLPVDALLSPIEPEKFAIDGVADMIATFRHARHVKMNANQDDGGTYPEMRFLGIFLNKVTRTFPRHRRTVEMLAEAHGKLVLPKYLATRSAVGEAQSANIPIWDLGTSSSREAANEMREACDFILELLGGQP